MNSTPSKAGSSAHQPHEKHPVKVKGAQDATTSEVLIEAWPADRKMKTGVKYWILCWVLSVISVLVPLLHFVLVPLFFILGPVMFFIYQKKQSMVMGGEAICPDCGGRVEFHKQELHWPFKVVCETNYDHLEVDKL